MRTIYKYEIETTDTQELNLPYGAEILCVQVQNGKPCIWALIDTEQNLIDEHTIITVGTGHRLGYTFSKANYLGTYQLQGGALVFHVFIS
jgi:hypothetical protein